MPLKKDQDQKVFRAKLWLCCVIVSIRYGPESGSTIPKINTPTEPAALKVFRPLQSRFSIATNGIEKT
jgi:hypothetical protein